MENETYVIIVTYANRYELCIQSIEACIDQGIGKIILVNNNSEYESTDKYQRIADKNPLIELVTNDRNLGSAGGFKVGMEKVLENGNPKFIWLLDDDNVPERNCLKNLIVIWNSFQHMENSLGPVLYGYRGNLWVNDYLAITKGVIKKYYKNNFMGFGLMQTLIRKFKVKLLTYSGINYPVIRTEYGPYGGMLIDINTFKKIGLPNENFYLYADDIEYSLRLNKLNVNQYLVYQAKINEIDQTYSGKNRFFSKNISDAKIYYSIRNHTYLSQRYISSYIIYILNKYVWLTFLSIIFLISIYEDVNFCLQRFKLIFMAIRDGERGHLGVNNKVK